MKTFLHILFLSLGLGSMPFSATAWSAQEQEGDLPLVELDPTVSLHEQRTNAVMDYLENLDSLRADFVQQNAEGVISRGTLHMKRPGKVRFEYTDDSPFLIVSDGETLNLIDYEVREITRWPIKDTPLAILVEKDIRDFRDHMSIIASGPGSMANMVSATIEDPERPELGILTLIFSAEETEEGKAELMLRMWQVIDAQGNLTTITLENLDLSPNLQASLWEFDDPRGERFERRRRN